MNKKMYRLLQWRILKATKSRFLSILLIIFIGTAFFSGLRITPLVMNKSTTEFLKQQNFGDITYISSYGITDAEMEKMALIDGVESVQGAYSFDALSSFSQFQRGVVVYSFGDDPAINQPYLAEGRLPTTKQECLIDEKFASNNPDLTIGSTIRLETDDVNGEYTIVGFSKDVRQLLYYERGSNMYGDGTTAGFIHLSQEAARELSYNSQLNDLIGDSEFYQQVLITVDKSEFPSIFTEEYEERLSAIKVDIEDTMNPIIEERYEKMIDDMLALLEEPIREYEEGLAAYHNNVEMFEAKKINTELQLLESRLLLLEQRQILQSAQTEFAQGTTSILEELATIDNRMNEIQNELASTIESIPNEGEEHIVPEMGIVFNDAQASLQELQASLDQIHLLLEASVMLENSQLELDKAEVELEIGEATFQRITKETEATFAEAKRTLDEAEQEINATLATIDSIPDPFTMLLDYQMNQGLASFHSDSDRIDALAKVFPTIFFLVAALVSLTTMTRMVEEQRTQNGTLLAVGYSKRDIILQYLLYALLATCIGSILGITVGIYLFPAIIYGLYSSMMYDIPQKMVVSTDIVLFLQTAGVAIVTIWIATLSSCLKELNVVPAALMRAKAPKVGKRIFIERVPWLWRRLSFNQKVTFRNIFRYKKRFFMSVIGIAGCSALLVTGYGVKYSVMDMASRQFGDIQIYDVSVNFKDPIVEEEADHLASTFKQDNPLINEQLLAFQSTSEVKQNGESLDSYIVIPKSLHRMPQYFQLYDYKTSDLIAMDEDSVIISQKAAEILDVKVNDSIRITIEENDYDVTISNICQNYLQHYIYMSPSVYASLTGQSIAYNTNYINMSDVTETTKQTLGNDLMRYDSVMSLTFNSTIAENFMTQMSSIDLVVWLMIISAGLLAFIVLYNLTNINIKERTNEIATIKVLGFYPKEVNDYIFRENKVLTIIGSLVGCIFGIMLHQFILQTVEVEFMMFVRTIRPISFIYAIVITYVFTLIINFMMRSILKTIDMIASLKQVE